MNRFLPIIAALLCLAANLCRAQETVNWEPIAKRSQLATVTVRVCTQNCARPEVGDKDVAEKVAKKEDVEVRPQVSVCSGFFVSEKLLVTAIHAGTDSSIRLTYTDGTQASGALKVVDEYSGLVLLEADQPAPAKIDVAQDLPAAGSWVMTAAAWGTEKPLVSLGIVSATDRTVAGVNYPPLLQCDLRVSETSGGSPVVNKQGALVGVMVAADGGDASRGWAYAVPAVHVSRLLRAKSENAGQNVVVLKRRRAVAGLDLDGQESGIVVRRVLSGSPAEKAGIKVGDQVIATDGVKIRSVYQALLPTLRKQPGDMLTFRIRRGEDEQDISLVLGGGMELSSVPIDLLGGIVQPKVSISTVEKGTYTVRMIRGATKNLAAPEANGGPATPADKSAERQLLEKALDSYRNTIEAQRAEIDALKKELGDLKKK